MRRHRKLLRRIFVAEAYRTYGNLSRFFIRVFAGVMFMQFGIRQIANYDFFVKYFPDLLGMGSAATLDMMIAFGFLTRLSVVLPTLSMAVAEWYILDNGLMAGIANMPMGEVALMSSLQLGYVPLLFVGMFVFIMLAGPGKVSVDYLLSLYFTNKDSLNELKNF